MQKNLFDYVSQNQRDGLSKNCNTDFNASKCVSKDEKQKTNESLNSFAANNFSINKDSSNAQSGTGIDGGCHTNGISPSLEEQAKAAYQKYQNFSQDELMNEFLKTSKQKMREGSLTPEKLQNTVNSLSPFLNNSQKEFLKGLMSKLDD